MGTVLSPPHSSRWAPDGSSRVAVLSVLCGRTKDAEGTEGTRTFCFDVPEMKKMQKVQALVSCKVDCAYRPGSGQMSPKMTPVEMAAHRSVHTATAQPRTRWH